MAKSALDLRGGKGRNMELDFLRLLYAVEHFRARGFGAQGYLLVMTTGIAGTIGSWVRKYNASECVDVATATLTDDDLDLLRVEKAGNAAGIVRSLVDSGEASRSCADTGRL